MGRKLKYLTDDEKKEANNKKARKYYQKNKERIRKQRMQKYWEIVKNLRVGNF